VGVQAQEGREGAGDQAQGEVGGTRFHPIGGD
jgi:hypothetical protein